MGESTGSTYVRPGAKAPPTPDTQTSTPPITTNFIMVREGTRSQTGNSRPRVFSVPDTAPVQKRRSTKAKPAAAAGAGAGAGRKPGPKKSAAGATGKAAGGVTKKAKKGTAGKVATKVCQGLPISSAVWHICVLVPRRQRVG